MVTDFVTEHAATPEIAVSAMVVAITLVVALKAGILVELLAALARALQALGGLAI